MSHYSSLNTSKNEENFQNFRSAKLSPKASSKTLKRIQRYSHTTSNDLLTQIVKNYTVENNSFEKNNSSLFIGNVNLYRKSIHLDSN